MNQVIFWGAFAATLAASFVALALVVAARPRPFVRVTLVLLVVANVVLFLLDTTTWRTSGVADFADWFFDLNLDQNLGTLFASLQLFLIGCIAFAIAVWADLPRRWQRAFWLVFAVLFVFLSVDDFYSIHEFLVSGSPTDFWRVPYALGGAVFGVAMLLVFWFSPRREYRLVALLFIGLGIMGGSGILFERLIWNAFCSPDRDSCWTPFLVIEETFETVGATIVLAGVLLYFQQASRDSLWRTFRRALSLVAGIWLVWLVFSAFALPAVEAKTLAQPAAVEFGDGALALVGYALSSDTIKPHDLLRITFYWRANRVLTENYSLSVHLLSHPEVESLVPSNDLNVGNYPTKAWLPGLVMRREVILPMPDSLPGPASYWLMVRVWSGPWDESIGLPVSHADRPLLTGDSLILDSVVRLPDDEAAALAASSSYRFAPGFSLTGYALPQTAELGEAMPVQFGWRSENAISQSLVQFLHLFRVDGEEYFVYDREPFDGRLPTQDWIGGMAVTDSWDAPLPTDLPSGEYRVQTGMYDVVTKERVPVTDANGQPVQDYSIPLGVMTLR